MSLGPGPWLGGGFLLVDKPFGPTSHDVVEGARRGLSQRKIGHTGTLDPFASGLLILCVGRATRLAEYIVGMDKEYVATAKMGQSTDSHDRDGEVLSTDDVWKSVEESTLVAAAGKLTGAIQQLPPQLSAIKIDGVPAHRRVRRGEEVEMKTRSVRVDLFEVKLVEPPEIALKIRCSSGTYVRSLARDLGDSVGTGCHLTELRRTLVGPFSVERAVSLSDLTEGKVPDSAWMEPAEALTALPFVEVDDFTADLLAQGKKALWEGEEMGTAAVFEPGGSLVGIAEIKRGALIPKKVFWNA